MKLLAIDTSSTACSVALLIDDQISSDHQIIPMQQAQNILIFIDQILLSNKISLNQLDAIAFGCGPGSFTGIRIAASVIQGLGYALNLPILSVSSLAALAQATYQELQWEKQLVAVDARIQEVYWAAYQLNQNGIMSLVGSEIVCAPNEVVIPHDKDWFGAGNAWEVYAGQIPFKPLAVDSTRMPMASAIIPLAKLKYLNKEWLNPASAIPVYLRDSVAKKMIPNP